MSIEKITEKILSEAQENADTTIMEAKKQGEDITAKAQMDAEKILSDVRTKIKSETEKVMNRRNSLAQLETRKMILQAKQDAVNECFKRAIEEFGKMDEEEYTSFLIDTLMKMDVEKGEVIFNDKDTSSVAEKVVDEVNRRGKNFCISEKRIDSIGGFKIVSGRVEMTATIESMVEDIKEEITPDVVKALFN